MEEEDDEFGELYSDVLIPPPSSSSANHSLDFRFRSEDDDSDVFNASIPFSNLNPSSQTLATISQPNQDLTPDFPPKAPTLPDDDGIKDPEPEQPEIEQLDGDSNHQTGVSVSGSISVPVSPPSGDGVRVSERTSEVDKGESGAFNGEKVEIDVPIADLDSEPVIPGLSTGTVVGFASAEAAKIIDKRVDSGGGDDWDSDSEDELQIVLNDNTAPLGADRNQGMEMDDEDDEDGEDLVIVADNEAPLSQPIEEQDWGEDLAPSAADGERKEGGDAIKVNGGVGGPFGARIGYTNHGYHQHHSQFKYVRPGAAGGPGSAPGQVRPLIAMGPVASQGRGDWRMMGIKSMGNMQKSFHPGYGPPVWANNSSVRPYGSGMDFTLPSHKTVFDIDIDSFEEKPWRLPVVDISDYFNFGLDEDTWKDYCKQLEQLRLEASMQGKIRVYESGRSEQDYDPDLPPELAAAAGLHDISVDNANLGKTDGGQADSVGLGRGATYIQRQLPTGRAIQVEGGYGERLPSIDTRPPRNRDSDSVIEIVLQDSVDDDSITSNGTLEQTESEAQVDLKKGHKVEEPSYFNRFQQTYCDRKREATSGSETFMGRNQDNILDGDRILPFMSEIPINHLARSTMQGQTPPAEDFDNSQGGRWIKGTSQERDPHASSKTLNNTKSTHSAQMKKFDGHQREKSVDSFGDKQPSEAVSPNKVKVVRQPSIEQKGVEEQLALADSAEVEGDEVASDLGVPSESHEESNLIHSLGKQKLSSRVEPAVQENENGDGLRPSGSDSSKARSGGSRDYQKRREGGEEEVIHDGRSKRTREERRARDDSVRGYPRRDEYGRDGRQEMDRTQTTARLKEDFGHSYPHREWDSSSGHYSRAKAEGFERQMETDSSVGVRQRRDDEIHVRRAKDEEIMRRRDIVEETGSRHKNMIRESERKEKDEHLFLRKRVDDSELRGRHEKDLGPSRQRQRDDILLGRHEGLDDPHFKRRKDDVLHRREHEKEDGLHGFRSREDRRKRERDDVVDPRRRDSQVKLRDKPDDHHHSARQREESRRQREREDRQKVKQLQEESKWVGSGRGKEESKGLGSDKDYSHRDKRRQIEESKRRERVEEETSSQHREREDKSHENQFNNEEWNSRHERLSGQNDRSVGQYKERDRDTSRKNKESEAGDHNTLGPVRKKLDDHSSRKNEKVTTKSSKQQESTAVQGAGLVDSRSHELPRSSSAVHSGKGHHRRNELPKRPSVIDGEDVPSDEDLQHNSRKGRSKFERWTSHKERDLNPNPQTSSPKANKDTEKHINDASVGTKQQVESDKAADAFNNENAELEPKDGVMVPSSDNLSIEPDKIGDDGHLDTVAKLKKRSERFKLPLPTEKDTTTSRKVEIEAVVAHIVSAPDAEVKQERPARKRRWVSS